MTVRKLTLLYTAVLLATPAPAAEITVRPPLTSNSASITMVYMEGKIYWWDAFKFKRLTEALTGNVVVTLNSPGGAAEGAISIGSFVRMNRWTTRVGRGGKCSSACALIWFAGINRELDQDGCVGVHSAAMPDGSGRRNDAGNEKVAAYLRAIDVPEEVIRRWRKAEPRDMDYIYFQEARHLGLVTKFPPKRDESWHPKRPPFWHELMEPGPPLREMLKPEYLTTQPPEQ